MILEDPLFGASWLRLSSDWLLVYFGGIQFLLTDLDLEGPAQSDLGLRLKDLDLSGNAATVEECLGTAW